MKIIASDYDGTINFGGISEQDRAAIAKFRAAAVTLKWHCGFSMI